MRALFPTRSLLILVLLATLDMISTAYLHAQGLIVEKNPIMQPFINQSEVSFILVKTVSIVLPWTLLSRYYETHPRFVRMACILASLAYLGLWIGWFLGG